MRLLVRKWQSFWGIRGPIGLNSVTPHDSSDVVTTLDLLQASYFTAYISMTSPYYQRAKLHAGIKPTALCLAFDKENLIEFSLDFLHYIYNYYVIMLPNSHDL